MLRLTREVRFAVSPDGRITQGTNNFAGSPALAGLGFFFTLRVQVSGSPSSASSYLLNIKEIDEAVRQLVVPLFSRQVHSGQFGQGVPVMLLAAAALADRWPRARLSRLDLGLSPWLTLTLLPQEEPMLRLSQRFEFSASHRLFDSALGEDENRRIFGKCSNPHGHGHNYELEVTVRGKPDSDGSIMPVTSLEGIVQQAVIEPLDHKNLNVEVPEFQQMIPSVENIAKVIYNRLRPEFANHRAELVSVRVWETPKTFAEYSCD